MVKKTGLCRMESLWRPADEQHAREVTRPSDLPVSIHLGLCSTCNHSLSCTFRRSVASPVLFCEEFDCSSPSVPPAFHLTAVSAADPHENSSTSLLGLCSNCEGRSTCTLPKDEGGVWHCEEYV